MTDRVSARKKRSPRHLGGASIAHVLGFVALGYAVAAALPVSSPAAAHVAPAAAVHAGAGMFGEPESAASYWRAQSTSDCGEMAVADVVGEITGRQPTESEIIALAENTSSAVSHGPIWAPMKFTDMQDLPILLAHYGIAVDNVQTNIHTLQQKLGEGRKIIAIVNAEIIWNRPATTDFANHFVVVTGIDTRSGTVHLNDSAVRIGRDEKVSIATFERAWAPNYRSAIVTR